MRSIREVNPNAKLIQTEDLGKCHSTSTLQYQADFENERRWLSYELLCGTLTEDKLMYQFMLQQGIDEKELKWFHINSCVPHVAGFNYYLTSERYLDEEVNKYPECFHGGNHRHQYADVHTVHVEMEGKECGPYILLKEAWQRLKLPLAITECHLHSTREDQIRWFHSMWDTVNKVKEDGVDFRAITAWAIFGLTGWNRLVTQPGGDYEPGVFNVSSGCPKPTALARYLQELTKQKVYYHPILENEGWWQRNNRLQYGANKVVRMKKMNKKTNCRPLIILGKTGTLGAAFSKICDERNIHHLLLSRADLDITDATAIEQVINELHPWGIINAAGYVKVDEAECEGDTCIKVNADGPATLAAVCNKKDICFLSFSSDLVFDGNKKEPYVESDAVNPLNTYGRSKALSEEVILNNYSKAIVIRTSSFFGPWDKYNFVYTTLRDIKEGKTVTAANDVFISPTYVPDLVNTSLDLILDGEAGIFHVTNDGSTTWADLARQIAIMTGCDENLIKGVSLNKMKLPAKRPYYSVLKSGKGLKLRTWRSALEKCLEESGTEYQSSKIAV